MLIRLNGRIEDEKKWKEREDKIKEKFKGTQTKEKIKNRQKYKE